MKEKKMCKFERMLGVNNDSIRSNRIELIKTQTHGALKRHIASIEDEITSKRLELDRITDLAPDSADSLRPGGTNFNPEEFIKKCLILKQEIEILEGIDLENAKEFEIDMFNPEDENAS